MKRVLVIGAGASGMMAAITAARNGAAVTLYEKSDRIGKKLLATGNGKCNLSNKNMELDNYYTADAKKLAQCFKQFGTEDTIYFFKQLGLLIKDRDGYLYPYCEQAAAVLDALTYALEREHIRVKTLVCDLRFQVKKNGFFLVHSSEGKKEFDAVILACGSNAGLRNMQTEGYAYAKSFGHRIISLQPSLVQVRCKGDFFKAIAGVRAKAALTLWVDHKKAAREIGELQLTDYGISGIPVFQMSHSIARALEQKKETEVCIDFLPEIPKKEWESYIEKRLQQFQNESCDAFLNGLIHKKISALFLKQEQLTQEQSVEKKQKALKAICRKMKEFRVTPHAVNPFAQAQVCCGGVDFLELDASLQSIYQKNLYMCGEMIDIDGKCGGYNLQWAWTSGYIVGNSAAREKQR